MGLFDKKYCDFCGEKISLLGNKKLEDANMCKACASKLSPWFSERRHSTKADIDKQLEYREQNKAAVASFSATRTLGTASTKLLIDDNAKKFMVTSAKDLNTANPDVLDFSQALGCDLDVKEHRNEIRRTDSNGKSVSYNPPRYKYSYEFYAIIKVDNPYFDDMRFALSNGSIDVGENPMNPGQSGGWSVSRSGFNILGNKIDEYYKCVDCGNEIKEAVDEMRRGGAAAAPTQPVQQTQQVQPVQKDTARLDALQAEANNLNAKIQMQMQQGFTDPNDQFQYQLISKQLMLEVTRHRPQGVGGVFAANRPQLTEQDNMRLDALQDEITALRQKVEVQRQQGTSDANDYNRLAMLVQQLSQETMRLQGFGDLGSMAGMGAAAGMPQQQFQQQPQAAPQPAVGSQVVCPMCGATTTVGAAGICIYCGNKIV